MQASGSTWAVVSYTAIAGNTFTGCAYVSGSATGTVSTGGSVDQMTTRDIMLWLDTSTERGTGGAILYTPNLTFGSQTYDLYYYPVPYPNGPVQGAELIFILQGAGGSGTFGHLASGTVDILGPLNYLVGQGFNLGSPSYLYLSLFGWEICNTDVQPDSGTTEAKTFIVNNFTYNAALSGTGAGTGTAAGAGAAAAASTQAAAAAAAGAGSVTAKATVIPAIAAAAGLGAVTSTAVQQSRSAAAGAGSATAAGTVSGASTGAAAGAGAATGLAVQGATAAAAGLGALVSTATQVAHGAAAGAGSATAAGIATAPGTGTAAGAATATAIVTQRVTGTAAGAGLVSAQSGGTVISSADSVHAVESAFYYILATGDVASAAEGGAVVRVRSADTVHAVDVPASAWPVSHDVSRAADRAASAWPAGEDTARAAEGSKPFRFALADSVTGLEVMHEMGIWTYVPVNLRLEGRFWRITGTDAQGAEVTVLEGERLSGAVLKLAERISWSRVVVRVSSADSASAAENARDLVAVTCWVVPAVQVSAWVEGR